MKDYQNYDAVGLAELVRSGKVSAEELLEEAITRAEAAQHLNAVVLKHYEEARKAVRNGLPKGPFTGVPFLLKDLHVTLKGTITSYGSRYFRDTATPADKDATIVARWRKAGFSIFGKTNSPELGLAGTTEPMAYGPTHNPWNSSRSAGGSSGGAAAAVAAGVVPAAHASDGGGSIRIPAANCGLVGFKPTRGRTPMGPDRGEGWAGMSISHVVSWTVRDAAAILDATTGSEPGAPYIAPPLAHPFLEDVTTKPKTLRIGFHSQRSDGSQVHPDVRAGIEAVAKLCADLGHNVEEAMPDYPSMEEAGNKQATLIGANVQLALSERAAAVGRAHTDDDTEVITRMFAGLGGRRAASDYARAVNFIHAQGRMMARYHETYDVLLCPTLGTPPWELGALSMMTEDLASYTAANRQFIPFTGIFNMTGQPSVSLPLAQSAEGLPIGAMFTAPYGDDATLFSLSGQLEEASPWRTRRPKAAQ